MAKMAKESSKPKETTPQRIEWAKRIETNSIARDMQMVANIAGEIASGVTMSALISGPPGIGKTYAFEDTFKRRRVKYRMARPGSTAAMIELLRKTDPDTVIVFDEMDSFFRSEDKLNLLKIVTDTKSGPRVIEYVLKKKTTRFVVKNRVAILTNKNFNDLMSFEKPMRPHIEALISRVMPWTMGTPDAKTFWEYSVFLAICSNMFPKHHLSLAECNDAIRWFTENFQRLQELSPRQLENAARQRNKAPLYWEGRLANLLAKAPIKGREPLAEAVPQIIPPDAYKTKAAEQPSEIAPISSTPRFQRGAEPIELKTRAQPRTGLKSASRVAALKASLGR